MKTRKKIPFLAAAMVMAVSALSAASQLCLTLDDALERALRSNTAVREQEKKVEEARQRVREARSGFYPGITGQAGYTRQGAVLQFPSLPGVTEKKDPGVFTGFRDDNRGGVTVNQPLFTGGGLTAGLRQAQTALSIEEETLRASRLDIVFETRRLYYGLLLALEMRTIAADLLEQARRHAAEVKQRSLQGQASRFDVLQSEVQVSRVSPDVVNAENEVELIAAQLKKLLGIEQKVALTLSGNLAYSPFKVEEARFLSEAYRERPEMALRTLGVDLSSWQVKQAAAQGWPQVAAQASYTGRSNSPSSMFDSRHTLWNAGLSVSVPIFEGFSTRARVAQARARYERASIAREDIVEQIAVDIRRACLDLNNAAAVVASQKDAVALAQEALRIAEVRYANAQGTNLDVLDAQVSLSQIRMALSRAVYDHLMAHAFLDRSIGRPPGEEKDEKKD